MNELLAQAESLVTGRTALPNHALRAACWLTRRALEETVSDLLLANGSDPGKASMRTRLCCLAVIPATRESIAPQAAYAWEELSRASHLHAFELSPTLAEVRHLIALVRRLDAERA